MNDDKFSRAAQKRWDANHPDVIKKSKKKYDKKNPVISFRPPSKIWKWLEKERWSKKIFLDLTVTLYLSILF